jgi:predicted RNA-binding Zn-ribbon protein involved in translation (DUF1610 family)
LAGDEEATQVSTESQPTPPEEEAPTAPSRKKPTYTRVILEVALLEQAFQDFPCPDCGQYLELEISMLCIASSIELVCNNKDCSYVGNFKKPITTKRIHANCQ